MKRRFRRLRPPWSGSNGSMSLLPRALYRNCPSGEIFVYPGAWPTHGVLGHLFSAPDRAWSRRNLFRSFDCAPFQDGTGCSLTPTLRSRYCAHILAFAKLPPSAACDCASSSDRLQRAITSVAMLLLIRLVGVSACDSRRCTARMCDLVLAYKTSIACECPRRVLKAVLPAYAVISSTFLPVRLAEGRVSPQPRRYQPSCILSAFTGRTFWGRTKLDFGRATI